MGATLLWEMRYIRTTAGDQHCGILVNGINLKLGSFWIASFSFRWSESSNSFDEEHCYPWEKKQTIRYCDLLCLTVLNVIWISPVKRTLSSSFFLSWCKAGSFLCETDKHGVVDMIVGLWWSWSCLEKMCFGRWNKQIWNRLNCRQTSLMICFKDIWCQINSPSTRFILWNRFNLFPSENKIWLNSKFMLDSHELGNKVGTKRTNMKWILTNILY